MKLKIAVLNPNMAFLSGDRSMHRWAEEFIDKYAHMTISYEKAKTYDGDIILCFNGRPDLPGQCPPKEFKGFKAVHLMDHVFQTEKTLLALQENDIDYVMTYNRHDKYDSFFKEVYTDYSDKVIPIPFGYNDNRFIDIKDFGARKNKVIALGSVNPVSDPLCLADIEIYAEFNKQEDFTHKWRRMLVEDRNMLSPEMDSLLPVFPQTKNFDYDIVDTYNNYKMFTSGESIMNYPSVKTFEGMACGSVLVCSDHKCYRDLGLIDGLNCIMHKQYDIVDFRDKVRYYQEQPNLLKNISESGKHLMELNFTPKIIAKRLYNSLQRIWMLKTK